MSVKTSRIAATGKRTNPQRRILVVDDDPDTRQLSVDVLTVSGYQVETARDGDAGWEAIQTAKYDLVITDNQMPRMTGIKMIEKVRSASMTLPIIMATSYLPTFEFTRRPWLMPDGALQRPFSNADLIHAVKKILGAGGSGRKNPLLPK